MRVSTTLVATLLPALISANDQAPLKEKAEGWLNKAKAYVASAAPEIPNPIDAGAAKVAASKVEKINIRNFQRKLVPKPTGEEEWMIYITGGNKTCHGRCERSDIAWNTSVPLLSALDSFSGSTLNLGKINCEADEILCTSWAVSVPSIFYLLFPQEVTGAQSQAKTPLYDIPLNLSGVTTEDIVSIPRASKASYLKYEEYEGAFHPIDGVLRQYGLQTAVGWILWGAGSTPSWLIMIAISFFSRQMMARKAGRRADANNAMAAAPAPGAARPAPPAVVPVGAASGASPAGGKGGSKRRK